MREQDTKPQEKKTITTHLSHEKGKAFLVQMRQSNKCERVRNDEIFNLLLGTVAGT